MKYIIVLLLIIAYNPLVAQNRIVKGIVTDENNDPLPGVTVFVKNTTIGTSTLNDGSYSLDVGNNTSLSFNYLGYESKEISISGNTLNIGLKPINTQLEDVIVVAYGTTSRAGFTGSASTIGKKEIERSQVSSISRLLQGTTSGVQSIASSGQPGSDANIYIRGVGSANASSTPLYIVDGAPFDGALNSINPADIESINVLKDAASTAIYGSRAANGLVIITTKQGIKNRKAKIEASFIYGTSSRAVADYKQVSTNDYFKLYWEALRNQRFFNNGDSMEDAAEYASANIVSNLRINPYGPKYPQPVDLKGNIVEGASPLWNDNWSDAYTQQANRMDAQVNLSSGSENSAYYISLGYLNDQGIALASNFKRYTGRVNLNSSIRKWLRVSSNISLIHSNQKAPLGEDSNTLNTLNAARLMPSFYPVWLRDWETGELIDGKKVPDYGSYRPSAALKDQNHLGSSQYDFNKVTRDIASLRSSLEVDLFKGLLYKGSANIDYTTRNDHNYYNPLYGEFSQNDFPGTVEKINRRTVGFTGNNILTYNATFNTNHRIKLLAGQEYYEYNTAYISGERSGFPILGLTEPSAASQLNSFEGFSENYKLLSFFGNAEYNYSSKYYASASIRRDGSSKFSPDSRWGTFWSVGASWRISEEDFVKSISQISKLSIRSSYGGQGNDQIGSYYAYQDLYKIENNLGESGFVKTTLPNELLRWETNLNLNIGLDYGFFENRISGSFEYFVRRSKDLLFTIPKAPSVGYTGYTANTGALKNTGIELLLNIVPIKTNNFSWTVSFNATHFKNVITKLPQNRIISGFNLLEKGGSIYDLFFVEWAGVDPLDGRAQWYKTDSNGERVKTKVYDDANKTGSKIVAGSSLPDLFGGFSTTIVYRNFDFSALVAYSIGGKIYNRDKLMILNYGSNAGRAMSEELLNRWTPENTNTDVPRMITSTANAWTSASTRFLVDADYLRLKNVTLGYNLPKVLLKKLDLSNLRLFLQAENLLTVFGEQGLDPEQALNGISYYRYPAMKTISFGLNLAF